MQADNVVVHGRFALDQSEGALFMLVMREARRRTGMTPAQFGAVLGVGPGAVEAYETGFAMPVVNVWYRALKAAGVDSRPFFERWVDHARSRTVDLLQRRFHANVNRVVQVVAGALALPLLLDVSAPISPWW